MTRLGDAIARLHAKLLRLGRMVQENLDAALAALLAGDAGAIAGVREQEAAIDDLEVEIEEGALGIIALHQPVADDLRLLVALLKTTTDLERIGDYAVKVAERARDVDLSLLEVVRPALTQLGQESLGMVGDVLQALALGDTELAQRVRDADDKVDDLNREVIQALLEQDETAVDLTALVSLVTVSRRFERAADHATNIAEDILYWQAGEIFRHGESLPG